MLAGMDANTLAERLYRNTSAALEMYAVYLGERLGYYRALAAGGPATSAELAERTATAERYTREWLEHQAATGLLEVADGRFRLPAEHARILADPEDVLFGTLASIDLARAARRLPGLVDAYRTGDAPPPVPWEPEGRAPGNRALFLNLLGKEWLPAIPDIDARLRADPPARVADVACGLGWSSIAMALAYPEITVHGLDLDEAAITVAQDNARQAGVADRVQFAATDATDLDGSYDLVTIIEALHDMKNPVAALRTARELLSDNGSVLVIDVRAEEEFTAPAPLHEQFEYGWSLVACLPAAMGDPDSAATGTVMRPGTVRKYATEAGFSDVQILPIKRDYWRFYRLLR
jgi:SAM-dependent methyltransferase